jgi:hypothetical protein
MFLEQLLPQIRKGAKVARKSWTQIYHPEWLTIQPIVKKPEFVWKLGGIVTRTVSFSSQDILADDWVLVEYQIPNNLPERDGADG